VAVVTTLFFIRVWLARFVLFLGNLAILAKDKKKTAYPFGRYAVWSVGLDGIELSIKRL
jgi:hypothetical protein